MLLSGVGGNKTVKLLKLQLSQTKTNKKTRFIYIKKEARVKSVLA